MFILQTLFLVFEIMDSFKNLSNQLALIGDNRIKSLLYLDRYLSKVALNLLYFNI